MVERINNFPSQQTDYLNGDDSVNYSIFNILNAGLSNEMFIPQSAYNTAENSDNIFLSTSFDIIRQQ